MKIKSKQKQNIFDREIEELNIKSLVLTGVSYDGNTVGALTYDYESSKGSYYNREIVNEYFHGTGDCYASAFVAAITSGKSLEEASKIAVDFTVDAILRTIKYPNIDKKYGVCFEEALKGFISRIDE